MRPFAEGLTDEEWYGNAVDDWTLWQHYPEHEGLSAAKLIPTKHKLKLVCMAVAQGDIKNFDDLYRRTRWSEVRLMQGLQAAHSWRDQRGGTERDD